MIIVLLGALSVTLTDYGTRLACLAGLGIEFVKSRTSSFKLKWREVTGEVTIREL